VLMLQQKVLWSKNYFGVHSVRCRPMCSFFEWALDGELAKKRNVEGVKGKMAMRWSL
jgi:hypothetical protein